MKKVLFFVFALLFTLVALPSKTWAADFEIESFASKIQIEKSGQVDIAETIKVNFLTGKHGIYRDIPVKYKDKLGQNLNIQFKLKSVTDEAGSPYEVKQSRNGNNQRLQIGSANTLVNGEKTYVINYSVERVINFFKDHDELYWNVTGNEWPTVIKNATAEITLPSDIDQSKMQLTSYTGVLGSRDNNADDKIVNGKTFQVKTKGELPSGQGLTVVVGWPKGIVSQPTFLQNFWRVVKDNFFYFIPLIVLIFMLVKYLRSGRDPQGRVTIAPEFEPPKGLTPVEMGTIVDERLDQSDISAMLVDLAVRGFIKIEEVKKEGLFGGKDYVFRKMKDFESEKELKEFEKELLTGIFQSGDFVKVSDLKTKLNQTKENIEKMVYEDLVKDDYFPSSPKSVRNKYLGWGTGLLIAGFIIASGAGNFALFFAIGISGLVILIFGPFMPRKTKEGVLMKEKILGFKMFLEKAEKERIKYFEKDLSDDEKRTMFEKYLPYAMVLGVASFWAKAFEGLYKEPPDWYVGYNYATFSMIAFTSNLSSATASSLSSTMTTASSGGSGFGGGGGAGGGFGGGGGGSW